MSWAIFSGYSGYYKVNLQKGLPRKPRYSSTAVKPFVLIKNSWGHPLLHLPRSAAALTGNRGQFQTFQ